jgi:hypothetical protein
LRHNLTIARFYPRPNGMAHLTKMSGKGTFVRLQPMP